MPGNFLLDNVIQLIKWPSSASAMKNSMAVPQKYKIELPCDSAILLLGIYPKELKVGSQRGMYTHVLSSVIYNNQNVEVTQVPMDGRMDTQSVAYTNNEKKKSGPMPFQANT